MAVTVYLPKTGMGIQEGTIVKWLKKPGDRVEKGEALLEFETVKATTELESPAAGILRETLVPEGETVEVGTEVGTITEA